jgi:hypothetical protein
VADVGVLVVSSPTQLEPPEHVDMIHEVVESALAFPGVGAETLVAFDGVRIEQTALTHVYDEVRRRIAWDFSLGLSLPSVTIRHPNRLPLFLRGHQHQARTILAGLQVMRSEFVLFLEHDTPLLPAAIDFDACARALVTRELDVIRFLHESRVLDVHRHLLVDEGEALGPLFWRTAQWSQRPHLARRQWYMDVLGTYTTPDSRCFVEDVMHGVCDYFWREEGERGWERHKLAIYADPEPTMQRSTHLDARRTGQPSFAGSEVFDYPGETPPGAPRATKERVD